MRSEFEIKTLIYCVLRPVVGALSALLSGLRTTSVCRGRHTRRTKACALASGCLHRPTVRENMHIFRGALGLLPHNAAPTLAQRKLARSRRLSHGPVICRRFWSWKVRSDRRCAELYRGTHPHSYTLLSLLL